MKYLESILEWLGFVENEDELLEKEIRRTKNCILIYNIKTTSDMEKAIRHLKDGKSIVIILKNSKSGENKKIIEGLKGAIQALDGEYSKINDTVYLFSRNNKIFIYE